jgi:SAM-dependent methyltransferase
MSSSPPFLRPDDLPSSLWASTHDNGPAKPKGILTLPGGVGAAYRKLLKKHGLMALASDTSARDGDGPVGGQTREETHAHFAKSYSGSCGRVQLFALDPHRTFGTTLDSFVALFSSGSVRLLDLPCGAGAASAVLLSIVAELRESKALPRHPLSVQIVGGDISPHAIQLAEAIHEELREWWEIHGIEADWNFKEWDVLDCGDTTDLLDQWQDGASKDDRFALVTASFSGFLGEPVTPGNQRHWFDEGIGSLQTIFAKASRLGASAYWVEPSTNRAKNVVFEKFKNAVLAKNKRLCHLKPPVLSSAAQLRNPVVNGGDFAVRACGIHLKTEGT